MSDFWKEVELIKNELNHLSKREFSVCERLQGLKVKIIKGKYKGREGVVAGCIITEEGLKAVVRPEKVKGEGYCESAVFYGHFVPFNDYFILKGEEELKKDNPRR